MARFSVCLQVNRRRPQNPTVLSINRYAENLLRYLNSFMIAMVFLSLPALGILWFTEIADLACGAIVLALVTYGCFDDYKSDRGLWMLSPILLLNYIVLAALYLLPTEASPIEQLGDASFWAYADWLIAVVVGGISLAWFLLAVAANFRHTLSVRGSKSPVIVDAKDLREP